MSAERVCTDPHLDTETKVAGRMNCELGCPIPCDAPTGAIDRPDNRAFVLELVAGEMLRRLQRRVVDRRLVELHGQAVSGRRLDAIAGQLRTLVDWLEPPDSCADVDEPDWLAAERARAAEQLAEAAA